MTKLPKPKCRNGFTRDQVTDIMGESEPKFWAWMNGQTMTLCDGRRYNHTKELYEESCGGVAHGTVVYLQDIEAFLRGLPPLD